MFDLFQRLFGESEEKPNKFTLFMGEKVRVAREEAGFSQEKLAELIYLRRATLSDIENGKSEADTSTFLMLAHTLNKPLGYFLPEFMYREIKQESLSPIESEVITNLRYHVASDQFGKLVVDIIKAIGKFDIDTFAIEQYPISKDIVEEKERVRKSREKKKSK